MVWVVPVESSMISSEAITLQDLPTGRVGVGGSVPGLTTKFDGVTTTARICARAAVDATGGLKPRLAAVAGARLVTASRFSKAPEASYISSVAAHSIEITP